MDGEQNKDIQEIKETLRTIVRQLLDISVLLGDIKIELNEETVLRKER